MTSFVTLFIDLEDNHSVEHASDPKRVSDVGSIEPLCFSRVCQSQHKRLDEISPNCR